MSFLEHIVRANLKEISPYKSARLEGSSDGMIALDANECPWPPFGAPAGVDYHRYPQQQPTQLLSRLADIYGVDPAQIYAGRGSDEAIDLLVRLCCEANKDSILICPPTFGMYEFYANVQGAQIQRAALKKNDQLDTAAILAACDETTKLIFISSPHAPLGHLLQTSDIHDLCKARKDRSLIVVDEAYVEFSSTPEGLIDGLKRYDNLVILRTLSKAHALAGERLGCMIAAPELIAHIRKIAAPYPLAQSVLASALKALSAAGLAVARDARRQIVAERQRMAQALPQAKGIIKVYDSDANFLFLQTADACALMRQLRAFGIVARDRSGDRKDCIRVTIGTPDENNAVLNALGIETTSVQQQKNERTASVERLTNETKIQIALNLDRPAKPNIHTDIGFFDHMLEQIATHSGVALTLSCRGDLEIDAHHTIEDCGLALGKAFRRALGDKRGIARFAFTAPLDEAVASLVLDLSGRASCHFTGTFPSEMIGEMPSDMVSHFFISFASTLQAALHINVTGHNAHHMAEACFKALGRALRTAIKREDDILPSSKGVL